MKGKVVSYFQHEITESYHIVAMEDGTTQKIDIMVSGEWPAHTEPTSLVGKSVELERIVPYVSIANLVKEIKQ